MGTRGQSEKKMLGHTTLFLLVLASSAQAENCLHPPPSESFSNQLYAGQWFEVGKYQTLGGSIFQIGTVCTEANFIPYGEVGDGDIGYSSRRDTPDGEYVNATGTLRELEAPGHFEQVSTPSLLFMIAFPQTLEFFGFEGPPTDYNVIYIDEDSAIEYDCTQQIFGIVDYCVHFMSRTPTMSAEKLAKLQEIVLDLGLNPHSSTMRGVKKAAGSSLGVLSELLTK